jgi:hypothetical protein
MAQVDRSIVALNKFLTEGAERLAETDEGSQFRNDAGQLRLRLLQFRQRVAANEPGERLAQRLREIEALNQRLRDRAQSESRVDRGGIRLDLRGFQEPSAAIAKLRDHLPAQTKPPS